MPRKHVGADAPDAAGTRGLLSLVESTRGISQPAEDCWSQSCWELRYLQGEPFRIGKDSSKFETRGGHPKCIVQEGDTQVFGVHFNSYGVQANGPCGLLDIRYVRCAAGGADIPQTEVVWLGGGGWRRYSLRNRIRHSVKWTTHRDKAFFKAVVKSETCTQIHPGQAAPDASKLVLKREVLAAKGWFGSQAAR